MFVAGYQCRCFAGSHIHEPDLLEGHFCRLKISVKVGPKYHQPSQKDPKTIQEISDKIRPRYLWPTQEDPQKGFFIKNFVEIRKRCIYDLFDVNILSSYFHQVFLSWDICDWCTYYFWRYEILELRLHIYLCASRCMIRESNISYFICVFCCGAFVHVLKKQGHS